MNCISNGDCYQDSDGKFVYTTQFHLKRGYCCGNQCRHCPYTLCPNCNNHVITVSVHGHTQCSLCKVNIDPCCSGETCL